VAAFTIGGVLLVTVAVVLVGARSSRFTASARAQSALAPLMLPVDSQQRRTDCSYAIRKG
jgi:hypothetical protein